VIRVTKLVVVAMMIAVVVVAVTNNYTHRISNIGGYQYPPSRNQKENCLKNLPEASYYTSLLSCFMDAKNRDWKLCQY